jgi:hypothetical protein
MPISSSLSVTRSNSITNTSIAIASIPIEAQGNGNTIYSFQIKTQDEKVSHIGRSRRNGYNEH